MNSTHTIHDEDHTEHSVSVTPIKDTEAEEMNELLLFQAFNIFLMIASATTGYWRHKRMWRQDYQRLQHP